MINVSSAFREELNNDNRNYLCYVDIYLKYGDTELQDTNSEFVLDTESNKIIASIENYELHLENDKLWSGAISIEESVSNTGSFDIGSTIINKATVVLNNIYDEFTSYDFTGAKVTIKIGLKLPDDTIETINKGIFYVDSPSYNGSLITLECLDSMSKFDRDYSESTLKYPATVRQIVEDACNVCGVSYATPNFDHDDYVIKERPETDSLTFRQMLSYIGQITCRQFSIDHNDRLISRWYDRSTIDELYASGESDGDYHIISAINSQNINQDDVVITGVRVTEYSKDSENPGGIYFYGIPGYVIDIKDNKLIPVGTGATIARFVGEKIVGMRFRPLDITFQNDPTIEPADVAEIVDYKGNRFYTFITNTNFTVGNSQTISCGAQSATRNSATRYSESTQLFNESKDLIKQEKTERERAVEALNTALANSSGMYVTEEEQPDGSTITYLHDKPTLEDSKNVIKITAEAIGISNDGGETYPYGLFLTGDLIARLLYVVGINADYINSGAITIKDEDGNITFYADTVTGRVEIRANYVAIEGKTVQQIANQEAENVAGSTLNDFVSSVYDPAIANLQSQIDGQIETWFYDYLPTTSNYPASGWTTDADKDKHLGDLFYVIDNEEYGGQAYRWAKINNAYAWDYVEDTAVVKALAVASEAKDTADAKRRVFVTTPTPPYDVGDLWVGDDTSEMMRCQVSRQSGNYVSTDWIKAVKYTDDTELYNFIQNDYADTIQEIYNSVDQKSETWYQPEDPSLNWTDTESVSLADVSGDSIIDVSGEEIFTVFESEKFKHEGDLWKDSDTNIEYIYKGGTWVEMPIPDAVFDEIDGKAQIFVVQPTPPYNIGDTWFTGTTILVCNTRRDSGEFVQSDWAKNDNYTDDSALYDFIEGDYAKTIEEIQAQTDQKAETWYQSTDPSSNWTTDEKAGHAGDLWYNTTEQKTYIYNGSAWDETKSTPPDEVFDSIDGKAQIFVSTPAPPYSVGDLWFNSASSDIMTCVTSRSSGSFNASDWEKRNKYTDDSALNKFLSGEYQETIQELKDQADQKSETWYQSNDPAASWSAEEKENHAGDLWYNTGNQNTYIYNGASWQLTKTTPPDDVFDQIDGKAQIFISRPTPPYSKGDLWFDSTTSDIMTCIASRSTGSFNAGDWQKRNKYTDDSYAEEVAGDLSNFADQVVEGLENMQTQIDGKIETYYYDYQPTLTNIPASAWTTETERQKHIGDLFYYKSTGFTYRFLKDGSTWKWQPIKDEDISKALSDAAEAQDTADSKRRVFTSTPTPPYDVGDLWVGNNTSDLMRCQTARQSGNYNASDWIKAVKYTDDTYAEQVRSELQEFSEQYLTEITNIQDQIDQKAESWYQPNDPSLDWTERTSDPLTDTTGSPILDTTGQQIITTWESEKAKHEGDLWKNSTTNDEYIYKSGEWVLMPVPDSVFDEIDGKAQVFVNEPVVPYYVGDILFTGTEILVCHTERTSGVANINDWIKRDSYTTRKDLDDYDDALDQESIFNRLTNNGEMQGLYILDNQLYVNASYIRSGALVLGGLDNVNGIISVQNQIGIETGRWDASGITIANNIADKSASWTRINDGIITFFYNEDLTVMSLIAGFVGTSSSPHFAGVITLNSDAEAYEIREYNPQPGVGNYKSLLTYLQSANMVGNTYPGWYFGHDVYLNGNTISFDTNARTYTEGYDNGAAIKTLDTFWINGNTNSIARFDQTSATIWQPLYATIAGAPSDERLKTNIQDADVTAIPVFQNVKFREFDWIETGEHENIGIIAQELEKLAPDLVSENHDIKYVNTNQLIMYCAKAIKELINIVYPQQGEADTLSETASGAEMTLYEKKNWIEEVRNKYAPKPETEDSIVRARMEEGNGEEESGEDSSAGDGNGHGES